MDIILSAIVPRTGSTLIQRIFNARRGTLIWGEHGGIVSEFVRIENFAVHFSNFGKKEKEAYFGSGENPNTWIANMSPEPEMIASGVIEGLRAFFAAAYSEYRNVHDRIGFKEVRYGKREIELLKAAYPHATVVLIVRHPVAAWKSAYKIFKGDVGKFAQSWNERALAYADLHQPERGIYLLRYEDVVDRNEAALALLSELAGITRDEIIHVLDVPLNSTSAEQDEQELAQIRATCQAGMVRLGYVESS